MRVVDRIRRVFVDVVQKSDRAVGVAANKVRKGAKGLPVKVLHARKRAKGRAK